MRSMLKFRILAVVVLLGLSGNARAEDSVALISDISGNCSVKSVTQKPCDILTYLHSGDEISVDSGSKVTLAFFADSTEHTVQGQSRVKIEGNSPVAIAGKKPDSRTLLLAKETGLGPEVAGSYAQAAIVLRGYSSERKLSLIRPRNTNVLTASPSFKWRPLDKGTSYRFVLTDESGKIIVDSNTDETGFSLPEGVQLQQDVYYTWRVEAGTSIGEKFSSSADFLVAAKEEKQRIDRLRPGKNASVSEQVLFAAVLEQSGFKDAATDVWKQLASRKPDSAVIKGKAKSE